MLSTFLDKLFNRAPTQDRFAQLFLKAARDGGYTNPLEYLPDEFRLRQGTRAYFNLHNAHRDYLKAARHEKAKVLTAYVATLLTSNRGEGLTLEQVRPLLRPVIRNLAMWEEIRLLQVRNDGWDAPFTIAHKPLGKDCVTLLAVDYPDTTSTLTKGPQKDWNITLEEALAVALENLRNVTPDAFEQIAPGLYQGAWRDGYDISRALLPDVLQRAPVKGRPVFMIPNRDVLLVTGDKDTDGLRQMVELSFGAMESGRAISSQIYTYDEQTVIPFSPPDPMLGERLGELQRRDLAGTYSTQKELLEKTYQALGEDVFVATYLLYGEGENNSKTFSMAAWTEGVETLLPKTDRVVLVQPRENGKAGMQTVAWQEVESVLGEFISRQPDFYPPRYRTLGFPGAELRSRLTTIA